MRLAQVHFQHSLPPLTNHQCLAMISIVVKCHVWWSIQGRIQDFDGGGGGQKKARTHIRLGKPEVPYGRGPGPAFF